MANKEIDYAYDQIWDDIYHWGQLIINLLQTHLVHLYNNKDLYFITMDGGDGKPRGNLFTMIE